MIVKYLSYESTGLQPQVSGKTTERKNIVAQACSPSKSTPVAASNSGYTPVTTTTRTGSNAVKSHTAHPVSNTSMTTSFQLHGVHSFTVMPQAGPSTCTSTPGSVPAGNMIRKDFCVPASVAFGTYPARAPTTMQSSLTHNSMPALVHQPSDFQSSEESASFSSSCQHYLKKNQMSVSATSTSPPFNTSTSTLQQRVVINTTTPLAAGTQILLSNARFVVPPQGLGPGTHVLIISSPSTQQVPTVSAANTGALLPLQGACNATVSSQSSARLPSGIASSSPVGTCTTAVGTALPATSPSVMPVQLAGASGLGSTLLSTSSALSKLPATQVDQFASGTLKLASSPPRFGSVPALVSPVTSRPLSLDSVVSTVRLAADTAMPAESLIPVLHGVAHPTVPVLPSPSAVAPSSPSSLSSAAGTPLHSPLTVHQVATVTTPGPSTYAQHRGVRIVSPSTSLSQAVLHIGQGNTSTKTQVPAVIQPVLGATRTQILPTVAVPPILSPVSKVQTLPVASVPPNASTVSTFETLPVETTSQPLASLKINNTTHPPDSLTNQAVGKHSLQTSVHPSY